MNSIRRELLVTLLFTVLLAGCIAAVSVYYKARAEIGELLDYQLHQMALAVRNEASERYAVIEPPPSDFDYAIQVSSEDGVQVYYSRSRVRLPALPRGGYDVIDTAEGPWRVYTLQSGRARVQVAQPMYVRDRIAARAAWRSMTPFILLLPLLAVFVWVAVTRSLRPLEAVADAVKARSATVLDPLPHDQVPSEIAPVVIALNDLLTRLGRALKTQQAFVADAAHELRTPLTALRLQLQLAERAHDEAERAAALASLREGLLRVTHLIEQLLTLAREEPSAAPRTTAPVDLGELAAEAVGLRALIADSKGIDLGLARRESNVIVVGERDTLLTLLSNLIDNALHYTPAGGCVDVGVFRIDGAPVLEVTDTGPGIPPDERERVFDRFYRRGTTDAPGSGLGLAIVRSIADRHHAAVRLDAGPEDRGLRVRVTFPADANRAI